MFRGSVQRAERNGRAGQIHFARPHVILYPINAYSSRKIVNFSVRGNLREAIYIKTHASQTRRLRINVLEFINMRFDCSAKTTRLPTIAVKSFFQTDIKKPVNCCSHSFLRVPVIIIVGFVVRMANVAAKND